MTRKVFVYIAASLDGYIAKHDDDLTFLSLVEQEGEDYGYAEFIDTIDTVIIGRKTYDKVQAMGIEYLRADKEYHIMTRTPRAQEGNVRFHTDDLKAFIEELKQKEGKHIFVDGGAEVVNQLMQMDLIDEYIVSLIPILLGDGIRLFKDGRPEQNLTFVSSKSFEKGLVQLHYTRR
ncbi:dihydrofolate reductase [Dyadobacter sp. BE34]|uniref:Dihydrofolate reductase n=1 Tax=Dyadobacter fermentans TaxID=94254 RepID=A0ABU1R3Z9_9BACT|nr:MULTISPECIES: dihydrofolate reductase family protein [Dyadobacter]MDR6808129.1 dihydrofolate reductase [Dyadobacter fermentans]MDR7046055.1 dihydrofolate reductase [Dyadobacter sp. BE242]MDR7200368.1 dihydrofolate reductase [Dyadobacter sp. BE34]MDR7218328.1 dihydrofolate reductase [Dyadobacter sp. BE31]MDR7266259.1 dihydrofolate reductase [Dyadobacter sp. BE32]